MDVGFKRAHCLVENVKIFYATAEVCAAAGLIRIGERFFFGLWNIELYVLGRHNLVCLE